MNDTSSINISSNFRFLLILTCILLTLISVTYSVSFFWQMSTSNFGRIMALLLALSFESMKYLAIPVGVKSFKNSQPFLGLLFSLVGGVLLLVSITASFGWLNHAALSSKQKAKESFVKYNTRSQMINNLNKEISVLSRDSLKDLSGVYRTRGKNTLSTVQSLRAELLSLAKENQGIELTSSDAIFYNLGLSEKESLKIRSFLFLIIAIVPDVSVIILLLLLSSSKLISPVKIKVQKNESSKYQSESFQKLVNPVSKESLKTKGSQKTDLRTDTDRAKTLNDPNISVDGDPCYERVVGKLIDKSYKPSIEYVRRVEKKGKAKIGEYFKKMLNEGVLTKVGRKYVLAVN